MSFAVESDDGAYRWWLEDGGENKVGFVMLNPSKASATVDDPTKDKCLAFAKLWMYNGIAIANAYPRRSTNPKFLFEQGQEAAERWEHNLHYLRAIAELPLVVVAWGQNCDAGHAARVLSVLRKPGRPLWCLGVTQSGQPRHPLYIPYAQQLVQYPSP